MAQLVIKWTGNGIARIRAAADTLAGPRKTAALRRAINHTGDKTRTQVMRALAHEIGASQTIIRKYGGVRARRASAGLLEYAIISRGGPIPLKHFRARQTKRGVTASPWRNRKTYKSAFIVASLGGHVFWRKGSRRLPIERVAGPNVPKELVKTYVHGVFERIVIRELPPRVEHEVRRLTGGVFS